MKTRALAAFHRPPENFNCAQAVVVAWQAETGRQVAALADLKPFGGGRAPNGECGAIYAACLAAPESARTLRQDFVARLGDTRCSVLKRDLAVPCSDCVGTAAELLEAILAKE